MEKNFQIPDTSGLTFEKVWFMMQKTDEQMRKTDEKLNKSIEETKALKQILFGLGNNLGQITEDYFYNSIAIDKKIDDIQYDYISRNLKIEGKQINGEYDIVLINSERLLVIEVKQKPHINDIEKFVNKQLPAFKQLFPIYSGYKIYGAIAGMAFSADTKDAAKENGLYILTQNQDSKNMQILNDADFVPRTF